MSKLGRWIALVAVIGAILASPTPTVAQASTAEPTLDWVDQFGTAINDEVKAVAADAQANLYVGGTSDFEGDPVPFLRKYGPDELLQWERTFGSSTSDWVFGVATGGEDWIATTGWTGGVLPGQTSSGGVDVFVQLWNAGGDLVWEDQFGTTGAERPYGGVTIDAAGNVYVAGQTGGVFPGLVSSGSGDGFVRKYDSTGSELWTVQFGTSAEDWINGVTVSPGGRVFVTGATAGTFPGFTSDDVEAFVAEISQTDGSLVWLDQFGVVGTDWGAGVAADESSVFVTGNWGQVSGDADVFLRSYSQDGALNWAEILTSDWYDFSRSVDVIDGTVFVGGQTTGTLPGNTQVGSSDSFVARYDTTGTLAWVFQFGTTGTDDVTSVAAFGSDTVFIGGDTWGAFPGQVSAGFRDGYAARIGDVAPSDQTPPSVDSISFDVNPKPLSQSSVLTAEVSDDLSGVVVVEYSIDGGPPVAMTLAGTTATATFDDSWTEGVYQVDVRAQDAAGNWSDPTAVYLVVYDPLGAWATGGGWIIPGGPTSDPGDWLPGLDGSSKAVFGFKVRYQNGQSTVPSGHLSFRYVVRGQGPTFVVRDAGFDWLVVTNSVWARFQGLVTIDGMPGLFPVQVDARDSTNQPDRFQIKIWATGADPDFDDPIYKASGDLGGGNVVIHDN